MIKELDLKNTYVEGSGFLVCIKNTTKSRVNLVLGFSKELLGQLCFEETEPKEKT